MRLDVFLAQKYPEFTRGYWQRRIKAGKVKVNGKIIKRSHAKVNEDSLIEIENKIPVPSAPYPVPRTQCPLLYEDKNFLVINKPAGISVHPPDKKKTITEIMESAGNFVKPVHRLDKDTSGILVMAKSEKTHADLSAQWKQRKVKKTYLALVKGAFSAKKGAIEAPIQRSTLNRKKMAVSARKGGREALTRFETIKTFKNCSLVRIYPYTGRTHQIRVHFSSIGHPVIGDSLYGDKNLNKYFEQELGLKRQFLHAEELKLTNPSTKKRMTFTSKLPEDLERVIGVIPAKVEDPRQRAGI